MEIIDFTNFKQRKKTYAGANGNKISSIYEGEQYIENDLYEIIKELKEY